MCIPHGAKSSKDNGYVEIEPKKHIKRVSQKEFEKGDPNFVDERTSAYEPKKKKTSFFEKLMDDL
jgi:Zn-finger nucleic acid-binding protein